MNCLVIDHKTVCVEASEVHQMEQMDRRRRNLVGRGSGVDDLPVVGLEDLALLLGQAAVRGC